MPFPPAVWVWTVSYTHLDVYKRQEPSVLAHILHGQLITGLIAGNGLVLGTVVLKHRTRNLPEEIDK